MKRMYVTLGVIFLLLAWTLTTLGQQKQVSQETPEERMLRRLQMRNEMHRRMLENLLHGNGTDQDMFSDMEKLMDEAMKESFSGFEAFQGNSENFKMNWTESGSGRTLIITPHSPESQLDINVKDDLITIKGKKEIKSTSGVSISNFSNTMSVPGDCDGSKVKMHQQNGNIHLEFPFRDKPKSISNPELKRRPLPPSENDVEI